MSRHLIAIASLLLVTAACAPRTTHGGIGAQLKPRTGPPAHVYVNYSGGMLNRQVDATVSVERDAHVLVGHLGGDGALTVLFPASPRDRAFVRADEKVRTGHFDAFDDGRPSVLSYAVSPYRATGALMDSYDGRGNGFVFVVTSDDAFDFGQFDENGEWGALYVENFHETADPRWAVRDFAQMVAGDAGFSLKFASASQAQHISAFASMASDCSLLFSLGFSPFSPWYFFDAGYTWSRYYNASAFRRDAYCHGNPWLAYDRMRRYNRPWYNGDVVRGPASGGLLATTTPVVTRNDRHPVGERSLTGRIAAPPPMASGPRPILEARDTDRRRRAGDDRVGRARPVTRPRAVERTTDDQPARAGRSEPSRPAAPARTRPPERRAEPRAAAPAPPRDAPARPAQRPKPDHR